MTVPKIRNFNFFLVDNPRLATLLTDKEYRYLKDQDFSNTEYIVAVRSKREFRGGVILATKLRKANGSREQGYSVRR